MKITPQLKDAVLEYICSDDRAIESYIQIDPGKFLEHLDIDFDTLNAILTYFNRIGFISELNIRRVALFLIPRVEAVDFKNRGGFVAQEELLKNNIEKLLLEIEKLKPTSTDTVEKITAIASNITTALGLFIR